MNKPKKVNLNCTIQLELERAAGYNEAVKTYDKWILQKLETLAAQDERVLRARVKKLIEEIGKET